MCYQNAAMDAYIPCGFCYDIEILQQPSKTEEMAVANGLQMEFTTMCAKSF